MYIHGEVCHNFLFALKVCPIYIYQKQGVLVPNCLLVTGTLCVAAMPPIAIPWNQWNPSPPGPSLDTRPAGKADDWTEVWVDSLRHQTVVSTGGNRRDFKNLDIVEKGIILDCI